MPCSSRLEGSACKGLTVNVDSLAMAGKTSARTSRNPHSRILVALLSAGLTASSSLAAQTWVSAPELLGDLNSSLPSSGGYTRSAPDNRAALHRTPDHLGSNVAAVTPRENVARKLLLDVSATSHSEQTIWGPWLRRTGVSDNARQLIEFLADIDHHGLSPNTYHLDLLQREIAEREVAATLGAFEAAALRAQRLVYNADDDGFRDASLKIIEHAGKKGARLERLLQASFTRLAHDLGQGVVDPRQTQRRMFRDAPTINAVQLMDDINAGLLDVRSALQRVMPNNDDYQRLLTTMEQLLDERAGGKQRTLVPEIGSMWVGHHHSDIMFIKRRMVETGDMAANTVITPMFDAPLKVGIMQFQERHGIPGSGIVDARTRGLMNVDVNEAISEVALSLERWRWMPRELGERHIFMNLPSYRMQMVDDGEEVIDMTVVIGSKQHPTPTFTRDMSYLEVNPTWTVPRSITQRTLLPKEIENPGYLRSRNFEYLELRDGDLHPVPYETVQTEDLHKRRFPYVLRQGAGPNNALGRVKFMMPNQYAIYFHDTNAKSLFDLPERAYSSGCIRVSDPEHLMRTIFGIDGRSDREIDRIWGSTETQRVTLDRAIPSHIVYITTWIDEDGSLQKRQDVYSQDARLREALARAGTLLTDIDSATQSANGAANGPADGSANAQMLAPSLATGSQSS